jgi:hypothetical protein
MRDLKRFLIERINAAPYTWGWGSGPSARDVVGADETEIRLRGQTVGWTEVSSRQLLKLIDHYATDSKVDNKVQAEQHLAAAILCHELGLTDRAQFYRNKIAGLYHSVDQEIARLLPEP